MMNMMDSRIGHIAVEGLPGSGHNRLVLLIAERFEFHSELESNWFDIFAPPTKGESLFAEHLRRLVWRFEHQRSLIKTDMFRQRIVTDYVFDTHRLWGESVLEDSDRVLYQHIAEIISPPAVTPDLVVYLQCEPANLLRVLYKQKKSVDSRSLDSLVDSYNRFFFEYEKSPALIVRVDPNSLWESAAQVDELLQRIADHKGGKQYIMSRDTQLLDD